MYILHMNIDSLALVAFMYITFGWPLRRFCLLYWEVYFNFAIFKSGHANTFQATNFSIISK